MDTSSSDLNDESHKQISKFAFLLENIGIKTVICSLITNVKAVFFKDFICACALCTEFQCYTVPETGQTVCVCGGGCVNLF